MKIYILFGLLLSCLVLMQCTPTTSTKIEAPAEEKPAISAAEKEEMKKELKEEIKKELEAEMAAEVEEAVEANEEMNKPKEPQPEVKPEKPAKPAMMSVATASNIIQGAWAWKETVYQIRGAGNQVDTPGGRGYSKTAVFKAGNVCEILINDFPAGTYNYEISAGVEQLFIKFTSSDGNTQHMEDGPLIMQDNFFEVRGGYNDKGGTIRYTRR